MSIVLNGTTGITAPDIDVTAQTTVAAFDAGITLGGSATTLDDYEEGTWTPVLQGNATAGSFSGIAFGTYVKVGKLVVCHCYITSATFSGAAGSMEVAGLPFTVDNSVSKVFTTGALRTTAISNITGAEVGYATYGGTSVLFTRNTSAATHTTIPVSDIGASGVGVVFSLSYEIT